MYLNLIDTRFMNHPLAEALHRLANDILHRHIFIPEQGTVPFIAHRIVSALHDELQKPRDGRRDPVLTAEEEAQLLTLLNESKLMELALEHEQAETRRLCAASALSPLLMTAQARAQRQLDDQRRVFRDCYWELNEIFKRDDYDLNSTEISRSTAGEHRSCLVHVF